MCVLGQQQTEFPAITAICGRGRTRPTFCRLLPWLSGCLRASHGHTNYIVGIKRESAKLNHGFPLGHKNIVRIMMMEAFKVFLVPFRTASPQAIHQ